jgi:SAM-dependent methyltransferase
MVTLVARIAPQKSTQYAALASALALPEWQISPLGRVVACAQHVSLGGGDYLRLELSHPLRASDGAVMGMFAMTTDFFDYYAHVDSVEGPFLRPLTVSRPAFLPQDMVFTRRYRGKTNEMFTQFLLNVAYFSSDFVSMTSLPQLTVLDPLCGGGTTLFQALVYGWNAVGLEHKERDIASTDTFLQQYLRGQSVNFRRRRERLREVGRRYSFVLDIREARPRQFVLAQADTAHTLRILEGRKVQLVVTDLPYGIQHKGALTDLLRTGLPAWTEALRPGGTLVLAWDSTRLSREEMVALVEENSALTALRGGPYEALAHAVDRVIKQRDVVVAKRTATRIKARPGQG